ncbi:nitrogen fixation protein NifM [Marinobacterium lutimaris]|uniref:peptidylprolyl isomerase n=1 Tax=Marinobacterium lutimaris TaxID=568106 RepID=A0A1H5TEX8_9GAMM|nr:nitrogen fixation protein NifM [Marinobacterium lutimaris]SEF61349.1 peptidyl-prolyl cis-trans isomerase C [Marinobacterium lutimaris]
MSLSTDNPHAVYALFKLAWSQYECAPSDLTGEQASEAAARVAHQLNIESAILYADENQGIVVPESQVESAVKEIQARFQNYASFIQALEQADLTQELLRQGLRRELQVEAVLDRASLGQVEVSEEDAELFYYLHPERFAVSEKRQVRHILITVNEDYRENGEVEALKRINMIRERVVAKPSRFEEQAQKHSECPTALHGGLVGTVERGKLFPELDAVLFAMKAGEISEPVRSELGFHLLLCGDVEPPRQVPLAEILPKLRQSLEERQRSQFQRQWIAEQVRRLNTPAKVVNA